LIYETGIDPLLFIGDDDSERSEFDAATKIFEEYGHIGCSCRAGEFLFR
jgi:hypothetical protein